MMKTVKKAFVYLLNFRYLMKFGSKVPAYQEKINVNPNDIKFKLKHDVAKKRITKLRRLSGCVVQGDWDQHADNGSNEFKDDAIDTRYNKGMSWEEIGMFEYKMKIFGDDSVEMHNELKKRYMKLDAIYEQIKKDGAFSSKDKHLITLCIGRNGELIHVGQGAHRIAIAKNLNLPTIPARIGFVHPDGISHLVAYRSLKPHK